MKSALSSTTSLAVLLAVLAPQIASAQSKSAQTTSTQVEEVIVTGQRQAYRGDVPIKVIPQNIQVLDARVIERAGISRLSDALDLSASTARQNNFGGLWEAYAVRGFSGDENLPSGYLVNGFNAGRGFGGPRDTAGIARIEILKGPNAALFGRGEPGGSVNIVTKRPEFELGGSLSATLGSFDKQRAHIDVTGGVMSNIALRGIAYSETSESFRDTIKTERYGFLPSALIKFSDKTSLSYELEYTRQKIPFDRGVVSINGQLGVIPTSRFLGEPGDGPMAADATGHQVQFQHAFSEDWGLLLGFGTRETSLEGFSTEAELAGGRQRLLTDGQSLSRQRRSRDYDATHTVWRGELSGRFETGVLEHRILIGADHDQFENEQLFLRFRPGTAVGQTATSGNIVNIINPVYGAIPLPTPGPLTSRVDEQTAWGVYVQDNIKIGQRLNIRIGGRYDDISVDGLNRLSNATTSFSKTEFSPQVGFVYDLTDSFAFYGAYGEGFRGNSGADFAGRAFAPEESKSLEGGVKFTAFGRALTGTASLFSLEKTNVVTADPVNSGFSIAIGEAESLGLELDLNGKLPNGTTLWFSYAFVDAQVAKDGLDPNFATAIRKGDRLINVPEQTISLQVSHDFNVFDRNLTLGAGVLSVGKRLGETATTFELPAFATAKLFASFAITDRLELSGVINNVFDETYYTNSFSRLWVAPGAPVSGSLTLRYRFD